MSFSLSADRLRRSFFEVESETLEWTIGDKCIALSWGADYTRIDRYQYDDHVGVESNGSVKRFIRNPSQEDIDAAFKWLEEV